MVVSRRATQGPPYRGFPVEHCRAGSACPTAFNRGTSSNLRRGRCPLRPADRRKRSYILHRQRQRRRGRDDTKFRTRPTETLLADRKGSQETIGFLRIFGNFLCAQKVTRRRHGQADLPANLPSHGKKQTRRNSRRVLICQKVSQSSRLWSLEKIQFVFLRRRVRRKKHFARSAVSQRRL